MPLLDLFWAMLWFYLFFIWIWLLIRIFANIFASKDLSGVAKALWTVFVVVLPLLGVLIYVMARGTSMQERALSQAAAQEQATREYIQGVAAAPSTADELAKLSQLHQSGVLTEQEFAAQKAQLLG